MSEWLLRRRALAEARSLPALTTAQRERYALACGTLAVVERLLDDDAQDPWPDAPPARAAATIALSLLREAAYWALSVRAGEPTPSTLEGAWDASPDALLRAADGDPRAVAIVRVAIVERGFVETAALDEAALRREAEATRDLVRALLQGAEPGELRAARLSRERALRLALVAVTPVVLALAGSAVEGLLHPDLAASVPWSASSVGYSLPASGRGFHLPVSGPAIFFHTAEEASPWIQFDLERVAPVAYLSVQNRGDCCQERAAPLVAELSTDGQRWTEVARRAETFTVWSASFARRDARFLRLRALRPTILHFRSVEIR